LAKNDQTKSDNKQTVNLTISSLEANKNFVNRLKSIDLSFSLAKNKALNLYKNSMPSFLDLISILSISTYYPPDSFFSHDAHPYTSNLLPQRLIYWKLPAFKSNLQNNIGEIKKKEEQSALLRTPDTIHVQNNIGEMKKKEEQSAQLRTPDTIQLPRVTQEEHISSMSSSNKTDTNVHTDFYARKLTNLLGVDAVTLGRHIFFAKGKYDPTTPAGIALLVHELTHIKQQENKSTISRWTNPTTYRSLEKEALTNEKKVFNVFSKYNKYFSEYHSKIDLRAYRPYDFPTSTKNTDGLYFGKMQNQNPLLTFHRILNEFSLDDYVHFSHGSTVYPSSSYLLQVQALTNRSSSTDSNKDGNVSTKLNLSGDVGSGEKTPLQSEYVNSMSTYDPPSLAYHTAANVPVPENKNNAVPFFAESGRPVGNAPAESLDIPNTTIPNQPVIASPANVNVDLIAAKVYEIIQRKIKMQREERGLR
jgi:hypothetical protein